MWVAYCCGVLLLTGCLGTVSAQTCDSTCQTAQIQSLINLYNDNGGSSWLRGTEWSTFTSSTSFATVCTTLLTYQTGYCCYSGDSQCAAAGVTTDGISAIILPANRITGTIPDSFISTLAPTMLFLSLYGKKLSRCLGLYLYIGAC